MFSATFPHHHPSPRHPLRSQLLFVAENRKKLEGKANICNWYEARISSFSYEVSECQFLSAEYHDGGTNLQDTYPMGYGGILTQYQ